MKAAACCWLIGGCVWVSACARPQQKAAKPLSPIEAQQKLLACLPESATAATDTGTKLEVIAATNTAEATEVRVRVTAPDHPVDFHFPAYQLSAGRWLINGRQRAYLVDEACRQFKLKDRRAVAGEIPPNGLVPLRAGQQFEGVLLFPRLFAETRFALLAYGDERLLVTIAPAN